MAVIFMTDIATGRCALYNENGTTGATDDPNAVRNAPLNSPISYLPNIHFHSDFDYYQVAAGPTGVTINHASVATVTTVVDSGVIFPLTAYGTQTTTSHLLLTHSLGYIPNYMVIQGTNLIPPSTIIQRDGTGLSRRTRYISPYATTSEIRLFEFRSTGDTTMAALSLDYTVVVFKQPLASGNILIDFDPATGTILMGKGKFDSSLRFLRRADIAGDTPYDISLGPISDIANGRVKTVLPSGATSTEDGYDGSFTGSTSFQGALG